MSDHPRTRCPRVLCPDCERMVPAYRRTGPRGDVPPAPRPHPCAQGAFPSPYEYSPPDELLEQDNPLRLVDVVAPHAPHDELLVGGLLESYGAREPVTPVVVLDLGDGCAWAVCGAHRLAAMAGVFAPESEIESGDLEEYFVVEDGLDLVERSGRRELAELLAELQTEEGTDLEELLDALWPHLSLRARAALEDQFE